MLIVVAAGSRPAEPPLARQQHFHRYTSLHLHPLLRASITETSRPRLSTSSTLELDRVRSRQLPHQRQSNRHKPCRTASHPFPAISSLGGFRTPAATAHGTTRRGRHPKTFTTTDIGSLNRRLSSFSLDLWQSLGT